MIMYLLIMFCVSVLIYERLKIVICHSWQNKKSKTYVTAIVRCYIILLFSSSPFSFFTIHGYKTFLDTFIQVSKSIHGSY